MSALARWFKRQGKYVGGYDRTETQLTRALVDEGIPVTYEDSENAIPDQIKGRTGDVLVVYTPAIPSNNAILNYFNRERFSLKKRSEVLGLISKDTFTIAVAGTHGKTTTSSLIAHIMKEAKLNMIAFLGGITQNYHSNLIVHEMPNKSVKMVLEADEYDRSFLTLSPDIAVVTAVDPDHLDVYGDYSVMERGFRDFVQRIKQKGTLVIHKGLGEKIIPEARIDLNIMEYGLSHVPIKAEHIKLERDGVRFTYSSPGTIIENVPFSLPGFHNIENAIAAITVCLRLGIDGSVIRSAISNFQGIKRRFEFILFSDELVYIDDYAHHPEEIKALLSSLRAMYEGRRITVVFQPHLFSRTKDFSGEFAEALDLADEAILLDIYPARELPIEGVSSAVIMDKMNIGEKFLCNKIDLIEELNKRELEVLVTVGAGDIDQLVEPIKMMLRTKYEISES